MILRKLRYKILLLVLDLSVAAAVLLATWIMEYKRPQAGIRVQAEQTDETQYADGGHCSFMTFQGNVANHPYKEEHEIPDGILITEVSK